MFSWLRRTPQSPVSDVERTWIDGRFQWLTEQFGCQRLLESPLILPTSTYFPTVYHATDSEITELMRLVAGYMNVDSSTLRLKIFEEVRPKFEGKWSGVSGGYRETRGRFEIGIEVSTLDDPFDVVATLAHEIGHVILLGQRRVSPLEEDHELLTDLLTVFLGLGIFTANSVIHETYWTEGQSSGWSIARRGYMSMNMYGYAFALYAFSHSELRPDWAKFLRPDVRSATKKGLRFLCIEMTLKVPCTAAGGHSIGSRCRQSGRCRVCGVCRLSSRRAVQNRDAR